MIAYLFTSNECIPPQLFTIGLNFDANGSPTLRSYNAADNRIPERTPDHHRKLVPCMGHLILSHAWDS